MPSQPIPEQSDLVELHFPAAGIDLSAAFSRQPNKPVADKVYARTTPAGQNVRGYEGLTTRVRGGSRNGLSKFIPVAPVADWLIQEMNVIVITETGAVITSIATPVAAP